MAGQDKQERAGEAMRLEAMAMRIPPFDGHPNRIAFEGVLTMVDVASDRAPSGAKGHRVLLTREAAMAALPSLLGMAVDYRPGWDGHDARRKCGVITEADVIGGRLHVSGYLFGRDFPEVEERMSRSQEGTMGMSYELANAHVADMQAQVWRLTKATFTGAAILLREKAAYRNTSFRLRPAEPDAMQLGVQRSLQERLAAGERHVNQNKLAMRCSKSARRKVAGGNSATPDADKQSGAYG